MQIDIVSDTICPWCFIGKRRLEKAFVLRPEIQFNVLWRPYRLEPGLPPEGVDRRVYLSQRFGDDPARASKSHAIVEAGHSEEIDFAFDRIERTPNTLDSHRLIRWASAEGLQNEIVERVFTAYFEQGLDIGNRDILTEIASDGGLDSAQIADLLEQDTDKAAVEREDHLAHEMGISGVPTFIFENKFMVSGAQDPETLVRFIDKVVVRLAEAEA